MRNVTYRYRSAQPPVLRGLTIAAALRELDYRQNVSAAPRIAFGSEGGPTEGRMVLFQARE